MPINPNAGGPVDGLVLELIFNEGAGGMVVDYSPMENPQTWVSGTQQGPAWGIGPDGGCAAFFDTTVANLVLDYLRKGPNKFSASNAAITVMAGVQRVLPDTQGVLFSIGERTDSNAAFCFGMDVTTGGLGVGNNGTANDAVATTLVPVIGVPSVIGVSQTGTSARTFFLNDRTATNATSIGTGAIGSDQPYSVGLAWLNAVQNTDYNWRTPVSWLRVWSRGLSVNEMSFVRQYPYWRWAWLKQWQQVYASPVGGTSITPQAFQHMQRMRKRAAA